MSEVKPRSSNKKIAIFGQSVDPHIERIVKVLRDENIGFDIFDIFKRKSISVSVGNFPITINNTPITSYGHIFWRLTNCQNPDDSDSLTFDTLQKSEFFYSQWLNFFQFISSISTISQSGFADNKSLNALFQLDYFQKFNIGPEQYVITNSIAEISSFIEDDQCIYRGLDFYLPVIDGLTPGMQLDQIEFEKFSNHLKGLPSVYEKSCFKGKMLFIYAVNGIYFHTTRDRSGCIEVHSPEKGLISDGNKKSLKKFMDLGQFKVGGFYGNLNDSGDLHISYFDPNASWLNLDSLYEGQIAKNFMLSFLVGNE